MSRSEDEEVTRVRASFLRNLPCDGPRTTAMRRTARSQSKHPRQASADPHEAADGAGAGPRRKAKAWGPCMMTVECQLGMPQPPMRPTVSQNKQQVLKYCTLVKGAGVHMLGLQGVEEMASVLSSGVARGHAYSKWWIESHPPDVKGQKLC